MPHNWPTPPDLERWHTEVQVSETARMALQRDVLVFYVQSIPTHPLGYSLGAADPGAVYELIDVPRRQLLETATDLPLVVKEARYRARNWATVMATTAAPADLVVAPERLS